MNKPLSLFQKILSLQQEAKTIKKNGTNTFHKYDYATEQDVLKIKELMNERGLVAFPSLVDFKTLQYTDDKGCVRIQVLQRIKYTVVDTETGDQIESEVLGQGEDKQGDKAAYKAATGANKYFYLKFAGAATGDDPEMDGQVSNHPKQKNVDSGANQRPQVKNEQPVNELEQRKRAKGLSDEILTLQKQKYLTDDQVKDICNIRSLRGLVKGGYVRTLESALAKLQSYTPRQAAY